jgi:hypothetical protein
VAEALGREQIGGEESECCDVPEVGGVVGGLGGEVGEGCAGVYCGGEGEEGGECEG